MPPGAILAIHCATRMAECLARFKKYFPTIRNNTTAGEQWATRVNLIVTDLSNSETASDCSTWALKMPVVQYVLVRGDLLLK